MDEGPVGLLEMQACSEGRDPARDEIVEAISVEIAYRQGGAEACEFAGEQALYVEVDEIDLPERHVQSGGVAGFTEPGHDLFLRGFRYRCRLSDVQIEGLIGRYIQQALYPSIRPSDDQTVELPVIAQSEMEDVLHARQVAAEGGMFRSLSHAAMMDIDPCAPSLEVTGCSLQADAQVVTGLV